MVNLSYANLPDSPWDPSALVHWAYTNFYGILTYLERAKWRIEKLTFKLAWEGPFDREVLLGSQSSPPTAPPPSPGSTSGGGGTIQEAIPRGEWIRLKEVSPDEPEETFDAFFEVDYVSDKPKPGRGDIRILGRDREHGLLRVSRLPEGLHIYVHPDTWKLFRQIRALQNLERTPHPSHRPLIRLAEDVERAYWPPVERVSPDRWLILTDDSVSGVDEEREFVEKALGTKDFALLEGPPGSGKTVTICELILQEIRRGHRVLLCASTHVAVDNVLEKLQEQGWMERDVVAVRIGWEYDVSELVAHLLLKRRVETERRILVDKLRKVRDRTPAQDYLLQALQEGGEALFTRLTLDAANLVCGTTIGILQHPDIKKDISPDVGYERRAYPQFDVLIVDEASKTPFPEFLVPALYAKKWILVGDPKQLSPFVEELAVEENLAGILRDTEARAIVPAFLASQRSHRRTEVFLFHDPEPSVRDLALRQAQSLDVPASELTPAKVEEGDLSLLWANLFVFDPRDWPRIERAVPGSARFLTKPILSSLLVRRRNYRRARSPPRQEPPDDGGAEETTWPREVAWRLVRQFELRRAPEEEAKPYGEAVQKLIPRWASPEEAERIRGEIDLVRRIALPSVLELLQEGFDPEKVRGAATAITHGFPPHVLEPRHTVLTYQHRMHPEISRFPRTHIYESRSLQDAAGVLARPEWRYPRYSSRAHWVHVPGGADPLFNRNLAEVDRLIEELRAFLQWASGNPRQLTRGRAPWDVAVLAFYRAQETELRNRLQRLVRSNAWRHFDSPDGTVRITLGTVDRFQGHEADMVLLSFVKNPLHRGRWIGFLDSPNRLNVAVTRARHQLVLIGNREKFADQRDSDLLRKLAVEVGSEIRYGGAEDGGRDR